MGLLKHVILPLFTLLDCVFIFSALIKEELDADIQQAWDHPVGTPLEPIGHHLLHVLGATGLLLAVNNIAAILFGNGFHRATACALHGIMFSVDAWSYVHLGRDIPPIIYGILAVVGIGLAVHSKEPGVFTKDKEENKAKSG